MSSYRSFMRGYLSALRAHGQELVILFLSLGILTVASALVIWAAERDAQPEVFGSLWACLYWSVITITTVGYGDMAPVTLAGRVAAVVTSVIGVSFLLVSAGILATGFVKHMDHFQHGDDDG